MPCLSSRQSLEDVITFHSYRRVAVEVDGVKVEEMKVERFWDGGEGRDSWYSRALCWAV